MSSSLTLETLFIYLCIHSINILTCIRSNILGTENVAVNKTEKIIPVSWHLSPSGGDCK